MTNKLERGVDLDTAQLKELQDLRATRDRENEREFLIKNLNLMSHSFSYLCTSP